MSVIMKFILFVMLFISLTDLNAQAPKKTIPAKTIPAVAAAPLLRTINDSASYAIGVSVANFYKQQGIKNINSSLVSKAINDIASGKKPLLDDNAANAVMNSYMSRIQAEKAKPTIETGQKFLAQNKLKPNVKTTTSGLQYEIITLGTGIKPTLEDTFVCNYRGTYINGEEFDNSYKRGQPLQMALNMVVDGWKEGLQLMPVGTKFKLWVPYTIGYGPYDYNSIPGGSLLIFEMELLDVKKK
jgi:FKBP-type peptidyl-prolyl cis-trans isomerase FklB